MSNAKLEILTEEIESLKQAAFYLQHSLQRTQELATTNNRTPEELERIESLTSRFARLSDLMTQRVMRLIDELELTPEGSLLDRLHRAEKRGWVEKASTLVRIRELRNLIAHEYAADKMAEIFAVVVKLAPELLNVVPKIINHASNLTKQLSED